MTVHLREVSYGYTTVWHCPPPAIDEAFVCYKDSWIDPDGTGTKAERHVYEWKSAARTPEFPGGVYAGQTEAGFNVFVVDRNGRYETVEVHPGG